MVSRHPRLASSVTVEGLLRLLHVSCGIEVEPQFRLLDEDGDLAARADLWLCGTNACTSTTASTT